MEKTVETLFLQGNFKKIVADFNSRERAKTNPYVLGALVFVGRTEDAEIYFEKWKKDYSNDEKLLVFFFLSIGLIRSSQFAEGKKYLAQCFRLRRKVKSKASLVFLYQGFGFYHHFVCRYQKSAYWAQKAWRLAVLTDSDLGQILSSDLLAHALFQKGDVEKGFLQMEKAHALATRFGQGGLVTSLEVSKLCHEAQFGIKPQTILSLLQKKFSEMDSVNDTYSRTNLGLELARQFIIRGQTKRAVKVLDSIQAEVFKYGHRRQKSTWFFRQAYLEWLRGEQAAAISRLDSALSEIDPQSDLAHKLQALGLRLEILSQSLNPSERKDLESEIVFLSHRVGSGTAKRYLQRVLRKPKSFSAEDRLGDLVDEIAFQKNSTLQTTQKICELGYFQLLSSQIKPSRQQILMEVLPGALVTFSEGNIEYQNQALTPLLQRTLLFLKSGPKSKKDLIEGLWGYQYDPLRHDSLIHAALARLRKSLAQHADWIRFENESYILEPGVEVRVYEHSQLVMSKEELPEVVFEQSLNYRQIKLLNELKLKREMSIRECMNSLGATKITANRDVKFLLEKGLISKTGQGKSTRYHV